VPIRVPGLDRVPAGPLRDLLQALHTLYGGAGRPSARAISGRIYKIRELPQVSHETVSALLRGSTIPSWIRVDAIVVTLNAMAVEPEPVQTLRLRFLELWQNAKDHAEDAEVDDPEPADSEPVVTLLDPQPAPPATRTVRSSLRVRGPLPEIGAPFVGRESLLAQISARQASSPNAPVVMYGPLGSGKTQLALEYARLNDDYDVVWWVDASSPDHIHSSVIQLANEVGARADWDLLQVINGIYQRLESEGARYLLIFDSAENSIRPLIKTVGGTLLITTRDSQWAQESANLAVDVPDLDEAEAMQLLRSYDARIGPAQAEGLIDRAGRSPLALGHLGSRLERAAETKGDLADWLATPDAMEAGPLPATYPMTVLDAVRTAREELAAADPAAASLLELLVAFGPAPISVEMLQAGSGAVEAGRYGRVLNDPLALRLKWPQITRSGLARLDSEQRIVIPALIRSAVRELLPEDALAQARDDAAAILLAADPGHPDNGENARLHRAIAPHVAATGLTDQPRPDRFRTVYHQIRFLFLDGDEDAAINLGEAAAQVSPEGRPVPLKDLLLRIERERANALRACGRYAEASRLTDALMRRLGDDPHYPEDHPIALDVRRSRGHDLRIAGQYGDAHNHDLMTHALHSDKYGDDDLRTVAIRYNLGASRRSVGRFTDAEASDRQDHDRLSDGLASGDRRAWRSVNGLAEDLYELGRYAEVLTLLTPLLREGIPAPVRSRLRARRTAGMALRRSGRVGEAVQRLGSCYQACLAELGEDRELSLAVAMSYGNALRDAGQAPTAVYHLERAAQRYQRVMGEDNPLVDAAIVNAAAARLTQDLPDIRVDQVRRSARRLAGLGTGNPFGLAAGIVLAVVEAAAGDRVRASDLSADAYAACAAALGPAHPDTLIAAANFAADRAATGGADGPFPSTQQVLSMLRRELGPGHPTVALIAAGGHALTEIEPSSA
jgi:tetratricopeptide (TPR) repeat protein